VKEKYYFWIANSIIINIDDYNEFLKLIIYDLLNISIFIFGKKIIELVVYFECKNKLF
jgi:hypothetical protein